MGLEELRTTLAIQFTDCNTAQGGQIGWRSWKCRSIWYPPSCWCVWRKRRRPSTTVCLLPFYTSLAEWMARLKPFWDAASENDGGPQPTRGWCVWRSWKPYEAIQSSLLTGITQEMWDYYIVSVDSGQFLVWNTLLILKIDQPHLFKI